MFFVLLFTDSHAEIVERIEKGARIVRPPKRLIRSMSRDLNSQSDGTDGYGKNGEDEEDSNPETDQPTDGSGSKAKDAGILALETEDDSESEDVAGASVVPETEDSDNFISDSEFFNNGSEADTDETESETLVVTLLIQTFMKFFYSD